MSENKISIHSIFDEGYDYFITNKWNEKFHFKISTFEVPSGYLSKAIEVIHNKGREPYIFTVLSDFDSLAEESEEILKHKIKDGVNTKYLEINEDLFSIGSEQKLRGRIDENDDFSDTKFDQVFIVDGRRVTVEKFMDMLHPSCGFNFSFEIHDPSD